MSGKRKIGNLRLERARRFQKRLRENPHWPTEKLVAALAKQYCVSERTVWRDLRIPVDLDKRYLK